MNRPDSSFKSIAILFIDLDRFKIVNDTLGHSMGDLLLKKVAKRLREALSDHDLIFSQGGDEFIVILKDDNYFYWRMGVRKRVNKINTGRKWGCLKRTHLSVLFA